MFVSRGLTVMCRDEGCRFWVWAWCVGFGHRLVSEYLLACYR